MSLNGAEFVFTGKMNQPRAEIEGACAFNEGVVSPRIRKSSDYLVAGQRVGKVKIKAAQDAGVTVITEDAYLDLLRNGTAVRKPPQPRKVRVGKTGVDKITTAPGVLAI